jgi:hypothetical protein
MNRLIHVIEPFRSCALASSERNRKLRDKSRCVQSTRVQSCKSGLEKTQLYCSMTGSDYPSLLDCEEHRNETAAWQIMKARAIAKGQFRTPVVRPGVARPDRCSNTEGAQAPHVQGNPGS